MVPVAVHCRVLSLSMTGGEVVEKINDGALADALVQGSSVLAGHGVSKVAGNSIEKTSVYSKEFIEWIKNIYGAGAERIIQGGYSEIQSPPDMKED